MPKVIPKSKHPYHIEQDYYRDIRNLYFTWWYESRAEIAKFFNLKFDSAAIRNDDVWDNLTQSWNVKILGFSGKIKETAGKVIDFNFRNFSKQIKAVTGINITQGDPWRQAEIDRFAEENARLIQNIGQQTILNISRLVNDKVVDGTSLRQLQQDIQKVVIGMGKNRAALIAVDQVGKLNGKITQLRQTEMNIKNFVWLTAGDERVRPAHQDLDGKTFTWKNGVPVEGYPGQPIRCRCVAQPDFNNSSLNDILGISEEIEVA